MPRESQSNLQQLGEDALDVACNALGCAEYGQRGRCYADSRKAGYLQCELHPSRIKKLLALYRGSSTASSAVIIDNEPKVHGRDGKYHKGCKSNA